MRRLLSTGFGLALAASSVFGQSPEKSIEIDLERQTAYLLQNRHVVFSTPICSGRPGHFTETGSFAVLDKERYHYSSLYGRIEDPYGRTILPDADADMRVPRGCRFVPGSMHYFIRFNGGTGMHAGVLPGYPASHGCVRLPKQNAAAFFNAVDVGTPVTVFGRTPRARFTSQTRPQRMRPGYWPNNSRGYYPPTPWWVR
jgi:lipoprotein-anchoring transpeptidase ErfK/SrfK